VDWALREAPVTDTSAVLVLVGLANHASDEGTDAYPSRATLARYARCSVRTVQTKLNLLEKEGVIRRGDQQKVAHLRGDRRPVVYDLNYAVKKVHPVDDVQDLPAENDVQDLHPVAVDDVQNLHPVADGVQSVQERGEIYDTDGVKRVAHKPSNEPSNEPPYVGVVVNSPEVPLQRRRGWYPSEAALKTAYDTVTEIDIPVHIARYTVVKAERKDTPSSSEWLRWLFQDEQQALKEKRKQDRDEREHRPWYGVAD
jgi:hypothetical protein